MLPLEVLQKAGAEITNYHGCGMSVMEMSHRSKVFQDIFDQTQERFRRLMNVPEDYEILFLQGGVPGMERIKHGKAQMLYDTLDNSKLLHCVAEPGSRSDMNVTFRSDSDEMDAKFVAAATEAGFHNLKGHRKVGGMRASIYNAMPVEGVEKLCDFIRKFDREP